MIWAQDRKNAIGKDGELPWHFSDDLKNFKRLTTGNAIIMGRKTWDSLPTKPLPNRRNIVISRSPQSDVESYTSIEECVATLKQDPEVSDVYIIGGMSIYQFFYSYADTLHITFIDEVYSGADAFFPVEMDAVKKDFDMVENRSVGDLLTFTKWIRK